MPTVTTPRPPAGAGVKELAGRGLDGIARTIGLTRREAEVLVLVAEGRTNDGIAFELAISPRTVHKHLERINAKLGVGTRTAAAARVWQLAVTGEAT